MEPFTIVGADHIHPDDLPEGMRENLHTYQCAECNEHVFTLLNWADGRIVEACCGKGVAPADVRVVCPECAEKWLEVS